MVLPRGARDSDEVPAASRSIVVIRRLSIAKRRIVGPNCFVNRPGQPSQAPRGSSLSRPRPSGRQRWVGSLRLRSGQAAGSDAAASALMRTGRDALILELVALSESGALSSRNRRPIETVVTDSRPRPGRRRLGATLPVVGLIQRSMAAYCSLWQILGTPRRSASPRATPLTTNW
jgi:hypothetical protein